MKRCQFCKEVLIPKVRYGSTESAAHFAERKYCDKACFVASQNGIIQKLHMGDITSIYEARKGRKAPSLPRIVDEVYVELKRIQMGQGRRG